jgi:hypothetical protein
LEGEKAYFTERNRQLPLEGKEAVLKTNRQLPSEGKEAILQTNRQLPLGVPDIACGRGG